MILVTTIRRLTLFKTNLRISTPNTPIAPKGGGVGGSGGIEMEKVYGIESVEKLAGQPGSLHSR